MRMSMSSVLVICVLSKVGYTEDTSFYNSVEELANWQTTHPLNDTTANLPLNLPASKYTLQPTLNTTDNISNTIFTIQGKDKVPKWSFSTGLFANKAQEMGYQDCREIAKYKKRPITIIETEPEVDEQKPVAKPKKPKKPKSKPKPPPEWLLESSSSEEEEGEEESDGREKGLNFSGSESDEDSDLSETEGKHWFLGLSVEGGKNGSKHHLLNENKLVTKVGTNHPGLFLDHHETVDDSARNPKALNVSSVAKRDYIEDDYVVDAEDFQRGKDVSDKKLAPKFEAWQVKSAVSKSNDSTWQFANFSSSSIAGNQYSSVYLFSESKACRSLSLVAYVFPLITHHQSDLLQHQSPIFTSQVVSYDNENSQDHLNNVVFHALLVEQTPAGVLKSKVDSNDQFRAQGTKKETKVSTPKWRLGAGAFLNKEIDEGSTEKETTFIPTIIESKSSGPETGPESDSGSDWDSDCDSSSSESDRKSSMKKKKKKNDKKKKTFKLFSLDEVVTTDKEDQKMVIDQDVELKNATIVDYFQGNSSNTIESMFESKALILQVSALAFLCSSPLLYPATTLEPAMQFHSLLLMAIAVVVTGQPISTPSTATDLIQTNVSGEIDLTYQSYNLTILDSPVIYTNASDPELEALIKKKKKLIPKWQYNAGIYLEKKVNKKLLKKAGKGGFALMSTNGGDSTYAVINGNQVDGGEIYRIPSSFVVARASPNTHSLFAENVTDHVSICFVNETIGSQFQKASKESATAIDETIEESSSGSFSYDPQTCIWTVLLVAFCLL
ncbi:hypothetical protein KGF57_003222 [Candida theae]|uniref:Uncharacterized protein n=1 Tax=Candida theae TaxID=1198502 RepID=A0AAD5BDW9_9ASCO|nr:uncharacterized protein KGF57_003222 [Candida theae]KAI5957528.1 hypothetical protein KGF57_003222 [Candida theae]